jgi:hypothetical protein
MTWALCFHCGATKFGAICPCPECQVSSTGDMNLDIAFSDHHLSNATLEAFGEVVRSIHSVCDDDALRFWCFIEYVSNHHPDILHVSLPEEQQRQCEEILARANPPPVVVEESPRAKWIREAEDRDDGAAADREPSN